jgi:hypothetical protein
MNETKALNDCILLSHINMQWLIDTNSLGAVYNAGYFRMSTWIPFIWALINVMVIIVTSFTMQAGL